MQQCGFSEEGQVCMERIVLPWLMTRIDGGHLNFSGNPGIGAGNLPAVRNCQRMLTWIEQK